MLGLAGTGYGLLRLAVLYRALFPLRTHCEPGHMRCVTRIMPVSSPDPPISCDGDDVASLACRLTEAWSQFGFEHESPVRVSTADAHDRSLRLAVVALGSVVPCWRIEL